MIEIVMTDAMNSILATQPLPPATRLVPAGEAAPSSGISFGDVLDAINPLQHIPVVSSIYRAATGTAISGFAQIAGGALFGGLAGGLVSGVVSSAVDVAVKEASGKNIAEHVVSTVEDATESSTGTVSDKAVKLVPVEGLTPEAAIANAKASLDEQAAAAASFILREGGNARQVAGQYQRAQTLDITNKILMNAL